MRVWVKALAFLLVSVVVVAFWLGRSTTAAADPDTDGNVWVAVDGFERASNTSFYVRGMLEGDTASGWSSRYTSHDSSGIDDGATVADSCERYALMMMDKPGRYRMTIYPSEQDSQRAACRLEVVSP